MKLRLRTKFLLSMLLITSGLTVTSLLLVRHSVQRQVKLEIAADLQNSVTTFQNFQRSREITLTHSAELLADLPIVRALMTTQHEATIQDASNNLWKLAGSDLFVLFDQAGHVVALHTTSPGFTRAMAQQALSTPSDKEGRWWLGAGHLYEVFVRPVYFGPAADNRVLGYLSVGYEINDELASQVGRIAASDVAFYYDNAIVKSTLTAADEAKLADSVRINSLSNSASVDVQLGNEHFLIATTELFSRKEIPVRLAVLKSYDQATAFLNNLNRLLLGLGFAAVLLGSALVFLISHTFTRPLENLVVGVRALGKGDFSYPLDLHGSDEVAEVTASFKRMRDNLLKTQQELLEAERLATIGRMASSISHDLRHSLAAIVANAEFLCESQLVPAQREELYEEVRIAVNQMTELIDSLLEFSKTRESLRPNYANVRNTLDRVVQAIRVHPEFNRVQITVHQTGHSEGWFDARKLERVLFNLLLNACEAVPQENGQVQISLSEIAGGVEIRVADNGRGIPQEVRNSLFDPFVSCGKENGTGLGLTVVQKIVEDHGGEVVVEQTSSKGTVFKLRLPLPLSPDHREGFVEDKQSSLTHTKPI
jgi:signal transduction histidine kinase